MYEFLIVKELVHQASAIKFQATCSSIALSPYLHCNKEKTPPFFITLEFQSLHVHNYVVDSNVSDYGKFGVRNHQIL
jgi:hypothetical protein